MIVSLPPRIQTPEQLSELVIELREHIDKLHDRAVRRRVANAHDELMPGLSPFARQLLEANDVTPAAAQDLHQLLIQFEEARILAPRARVMLPAWPDAGIREQITTHVRTSIHPLMMLTFTVRADMGGGCVLQVGSHRYDFSFHTQLFTNRHKISELLNSYAKS